MTKDCSLEHWKNPEEITAETHLYKENRRFFDFFWLSSLHCERHLLDRVSPFLLLFRDKLSIKRGTEFALERIWTFSFFKAPQIDNLARKQQKANSRLAVSARSLPFSCSAHTRPEIMWRRGKRRRQCTFKNHKKHKKKTNRKPNVMGKRNLWRSSRRCPRAWLLLLSTCIVFISFANQAQTIFLCNCLKNTQYLHKKDKKYMYNNNDNDESGPVSILTGKWTLKTFSEGISWSFF